MSEQGQPKDELKDEFEKLGGNLRSLIQGAWESEQRKKASQEVQRGLDEVGEALSNAAAELAQDPAARKLREEVDQLADRVRSGELAERARSELIEVLQGVNERLNKLVDQLESSLAQGEDGPDAS
jgi:uncharacterized phage infection (PIP) family protein YhgE